MKQLAFEKAPRRPLKVVRRVFQFQTRDWHNKEWSEAKYSQHCNPLRHLTSRNVLAFKASSFSQLLFITSHFRFIRRECLEENVRFLCKELTEDIYESFYCQRHRSNLLFWYMASVHFPGFYTPLLLSSSEL
jgi:hypothetical protein